MRFTAIHRALGLQPQELTWDILVRAVDEGVVEQPDLDWKREGYGPKKDWDELAKDVAAMANSGGGVLVLGVQEDNENDAARALTTPIALSASEAGHYRQEIFTRTHPPVQGVILQPLNGATSDERAVAIHVPASLDAPHLVYRNRTEMADFIAPFRDGSHTRFMRERQLEAAYRQRFAVRTDQGNELQSLYDETASTYEPDVRACIVAVARPDQPRPSVLGRLDQDQARSVFERALRLARSLEQDGHSESPLNDVDHLNPRLGLRRRTSRSPHDIYELSTRAGFVSLHDDGSISLFWAAGGWPKKGPFDLYAFSVEVAALQVAALVGCSSRELGIDSAYTVQFGVVHPADQSIVVFSEQNPNTRNMFVASPPVRAVRPVRISVPPEPDDDTLNATAADLALDCLSQAGVTFLTKIRVLTPPTSQ